MSKSILIALLFTFAAACGGKASPAPMPAPDEPGVTDETPAPRAQLTAEACEAEGGQVVGDIGDGATHVPDYVCADSGAPPIGDVVADPDGPMAIEGAVCCR